jgi:hypothetical protein
MTVETVKEEETKDETIVNKEADTSVDDKDSDKKTPTLEELLAENAKLKSINEEVIGSRNEVKEKLRAIEAKAEEAKTKELEEQGNYKQLLEAEQEKLQKLQSQIERQAIDAEITKSLQDAKVSSVDTALKLVDKDKIQYVDGKVNQESVADAIAQLKEEHSVLFVNVKDAPKPKRAGEETPQGGYEEELRKLQTNPNATPRDLAALRTKYGRA